MKYLGIYNGVLAPSLNFGIKFNPLSSLRNRLKGYILLKQIMILDELV